MTDHEPALHYSIVVVDIERYSDACRTEVHQGVAHDGLNRALRRAFADSSIDWDTCVVQDTGDGALILVPASVPKCWLVDRVRSRLISELHRHNAVAAAQARIRLRMAVHAGEVRRVGFGGIASKGVVLASRLVDAPELKAAQRASTEVLSTIVSDSFFHDVVRQDAGTEPDRYREVPVEVKETRTTAWLRSDAPPTAAATPAAVHAVDDRRNDLAELVDALFDVPSIREEAGRRTVLDLLPTAISGAVPSHPRTRLHVFNLVRTCLDYEGGLADLLRVLRDLEGNSLPMRRVAATARTWLVDPLD